LNVIDRVLLHLNKERLQGPGNKIKYFFYGPFEVLEWVGDNAYKLKIPPYMNFYLAMNVENLKLYKPSMLDEENDGKVVPNIDDLTP
jgi:hypothetical protein